MWRLRGRPDATEDGERPPMTVPAWIDELEPAAPDIVAAWRGIEEGQFLSVRREVRRRSGAGTAPRTIAAARRRPPRPCAASSRRCRTPAFALPGGEGDWNVAEAVGHVASSRAGLVLAAALAAADRWPADAPTVVPGHPRPARRRPRPARREDRPEPAPDRAPRRRRSPATSWTAARSTIRSSAACAAASGCSSPASTTSCTSSSSTTCRLRSRSSSDLAASK